MYRFGGTYTKIGTIQRRLAWPLRKDDTQNREAFHIFFYLKFEKNLGIVTFTYLVISHNYLEIILCREIHSKAVIFSLLQELLVDIINIIINYLKINALLERRC